MKSKWKKKGILTVEASFVVTLGILATSILLSLCIHVYQRCWYTQIACETALTGSFCGVLKEEDPITYSMEKWKLRETEFYLKPEKLQRSIYGTKKKITVEISGNTNVWKGEGIPFSVKVQQKIVRPVPYIRKMEAITGRGDV